MIALGEVAAFDYAWDDREVILYALSVGARVGDDLALVYENAPGFRTAPTFALAPMAGLVMPMVAALGIELSVLLHAGQELTVHAPLPVRGTARVSRRVVEVVDKGRAALVVCEDRVGTYATGRSTWWIAGAGGAGSRGDAGVASFTPAGVPDGPPAFTASWTTSLEQAALHRLAGDRNPVHIDPTVAASTGQPRPFLHGLCTFGALGLALDRAAGPGRRLCGLAGRFTRPVFPGDTLKLAAWDDLSIARVSVDGEPVLGPATAEFTPS